MFESSANKLVKKALTLDDILLKLRRLRHYFMPGYEPSISNLALSVRATPSYTLTVPFSHLRELDLGPLHDIVMKMVLAKRLGNEQEFIEQQKKLIELLGSNPELKSYIPILKKRPFALIGHMTDMLKRIIEGRPMTAGYFLRGAELGEKGPLGGDFLSRAADVAIPIGGLIMLYGLLKKLLSRGHSKKVELDDGSTIYVKQKSGTRLTPYILGGLLTMAVPHLLDVGYSYGLGKWNLERARRMGKLLEQVQ